ncbi:C45 family autoproteolytic acyltransferase/hydrolase [Myxococcota bacterium]|nr:C45 family autoproteolytic acyltransferase/hydrolase [Myxococcota bacterium]
MLLLLLACTAPPPSSADDTAADGGAATVDDTGADGGTTSPGVNGRLETVSGQSVLYLWGSRYELGYAEGSLTCDRVADLFKYYLLEELIADYTSYEYQVVRGVVIGSTTFQPGDLEEMQGYYQGALDHCTEEQLTVHSDLLEDDSGGSRMLEIEDLYFANALADFGCSSLSVWGAASATGDTVHARNFDWASDDDGRFLSDHIVKVYDSTDEGARFLSVMVPGMLGCVSCVTEEGVALTMHNVGGLPTTTPVGISPRMFAAREALLATVGATDVAAAAEAVLEERPQNVGNNLHLSWPMARAVDGTGAAVLEYDGASDHQDGRVTVRGPTGDPEQARTDAVVTTNHYIARSPAPTSGDSWERASLLRQAIDAGAPLGGLDREGGRAALETVAGGYGELTVHSVVVDSAARRLDLYVAPDPSTPAVLGPTRALDLDALFGAFDQ